ncbi:uncharacterized protein LOC116347382 [Contarinia nasturtii]|uniref:uncharacterized protein LOC116347382 n=1 Tax=Contarinia nasturtii TaxID=265458 RepID=UPI0012D3B418|nr:uncharacterized protein LOC116347382 [Contarinia nasturtii]XP_031633818.1 uncharacterized protein LOC116347382 [Contarinia nasturtii]
MSYSQKKLHTSPSHNQNHNDDAIAGPSNEESPPKIFKLSIDCFDEIFEYLNMKDLHSFGQTCKRINRVAGEYFKQNYSSAEKFYTKDGIFTKYSDKDGVVNKRILTSGFNKFMPYISYYIINNGFRHLKYFQAHISEFESTNHIYMMKIDLSHERIKYFKQLFPQLEIVQYQRCSLRGDFYNSILKHCTNLREIYIQNSATGRRTNRKLNLLLKEYPKLERFEWIPPYSGKFEELRTFFALNPNVQRFSTTIGFWSKNSNIFLNSNVKLDILEIKEFYVYPRSNVHSKIPLELLNQLHEQGFYKQLYIYIDDCDEERSTSLGSVNGLELLCIRSFEKTYNLTQLTNLRELIILGGSIAEDMEILANCLTNLERLYVDEANIDDILPFIRRSPKLNKIKFIPRDKGVVLNLEMMNKERAKLARARKIIIYTRDDVFLATKWTTRNGAVNLIFFQKFKLYRNQTIGFA